MVPPSAHLGRARRSRWSHVCGGGAGRTTRTPETRSGGEGGVLPSHACQVQLRAAGMEWVGQSRIKGTGCRRGGCPVTPQRSPAPDAPEWTQVCTPHPRSDGPGSAFSPETLSLPSAPRFVWPDPGVRPGDVLSTRRRVSVTSNAHIVLPVEKLRPAYHLLSFSIRTRQETSLSPFHRQGL